ncbi:glycoside hydrolase domain-containing protein [Streptomyces sp. NPDC001292]|uniref:glycoside hydrolase domain-containing protein n=1 Tax=Streptomyces sp. NPDC001292 TaxID=3364558 RepID=UPI0036BF230F
MGLLRTTYPAGTDANFVLQAVIAEDIAKVFTGFDRKLAYEAVYKDAMTPPDKDTELPYYDREEATPVEARAGLTTYKQNGWVAADRTVESASRTLDYAYEDWAVARRQVGRQGRRREDVPQAQPGRLGAWPAAPGRAPASPPDPVQGPPADRAAAGVVVARCQARSPHGWRATRHDGVTDSRHGRKPPRWSIPRRSAYLPGCGAAG